MYYRFIAGAGLAVAALQCPAAWTQELVNTWQGDLELGYVSTAGNSKTTTIQGRADAVREVALWRYHIHFDSLNSSEDDQRSAERYFLTNKVDYKFGERSYVFGYASYEDDRFSGFAWQAVAATGYGYRILDGESMTWDVEAGPGYRISKIEEPSAEDDQNDIILRGHTRFEWRVSDAATFEQELGVESGSENVVTRSVTSLKSTIIGQLAMKLSYTVKHTDEVPEGTEHSDRETAVTLVYSF